VRRALQREPEPLRLPLGIRVPHGSTWAPIALAAALVAIAVVAAVTPWAGLVWRAAAASALVTLAALGHNATVGRRQPIKGWLVLDEKGLQKVDSAREGTAPCKLVAWSEPFGVTVLASADRARFVVALTSARAIRYVAVRVADGEDATSVPMLLDRATTAPDGDLRTDDQAALAAADAERLLREIARRAPTSLERIYLSDGYGEPVVLESTELRVGVRRIDLADPLEWRAFVFQEAGAQVASVCQATWIRQGDAEVVLVAPMAAEGAWPREASESARMAGRATAIRRAIARDARLMQAAIGEPPPRDLRRAIDRVFMLPLRRAIDRAPRISRVPSSSSLRRPEGHA
jgi:hypothetical protein